MIMNLNVIANVTLLVAALLDMVVLLGADITDHRNNGHSNSKYYNWLNKNSELMSAKRLLHHHGTGIVDGSHDSGGGVARPKHLPAVAAPMETIG